MNNNESEVKANKDLSIFHKLLFTFLAVFTFICAVFATAYYFHGKKNVERYAEEAMSREAAAIVDHFQHAIANATVLDLKLMADNPLLDQFLMSTGIETGLSASAVERYFHDIIRHVESAKSISFFNYKGEEKIKVDQLGRRRRDYGSLAGSNFFLQIKNSPRGGIAVDGPFETESGECYFSVGIRKSDPDIGEFGGAVVIKYDLSDFFKFLGEVEVLDENPVWALTPDNKVLIKPAKTEAYWDPRPVLDAGLLQQPSGIVAFGANRVALINLSILPEKTLLKVCISAPASLILKDLKEVMRFLAAILTISLGSVILMVMVISRQLSLPLVMLSSTVEAFRGKETLPEVPRRASREVKILFRNFREMMRNLEETTVSRDYMDNILNTMVNGLFVVDPAGVIQTVNSAACAIFGYKEEELLGSEIALTAGEEAKIFILAGKSLIGKEMTFTTKEGREIPLLFSSREMKDADGNRLAAVCLVQDITELKQAEAALLASEEKLKFSEIRFRTLVEQSPLGIVLYDTEGEVTFSNAAIIKLYGLSGREEKVAVGHYNILKDEQLISLGFFDAVKKAFSGETLKLPPIRYENAKLDKLSSVPVKALWLESTIYPVKDDYENVREMVMIHHDISELKELEERLKSSLHEKEVLLREIHHRVKNNFQVISSLLNLQAEVSENPTLKEMVNDSRQRIRSMAAVHEKLYQSGSLNCIDSKDYVKTLMQELFTTYCVGATPKLNLEVDSFPLALDLAIPCGLIINELVSNALKHAFPGGRKGEIDLSFRSAISVSETKYELTVMDNGIGIADQPDMSAIETLGLRLVKNLATKQLNGSLDIDNSGAGVKITIRFTDRR